MAEQVDPVVARRAAVEAAPVRDGQPIETEMVNYLRPYVESPEEALQIMSGRTVPPKDIALRWIDQQIGPANLPVDAGTGFKDRSNRPEHETTIYNEASGALNEVYDFVETGEITDAARREVLKVLYNDPGFRTLLTEVYGNINDDFTSFVNGQKTIPDNLQKVIDSILRHPEYNAKLRELIRQRIDPTKPIEDKVTPIQIKIDRLNKELAEIEKQLSAESSNSKAQRLQQINSTLAEYNVSIQQGENSENITLGIRATRLQELDKQIASEQINIASLSDRIKVLEIQIDSLSHSRNPRDREQQLLDAIKALGKARRDLVSSNQSLEKAKAEKERLIEEEKRLLEERRQLEKEIDELRRQKIKLEADLDTEQAKLAPLQQERMMRERELADEIRGLFADAVKEYLNERLSRIEQKYQTLVEERKKKETDEIKKRIDEELQSRWWRDKRVGLIRRRTVQDIDQDKVNADMEILLAKGPRGIIEAISGADIENSVRTKYGLGKEEPLTDEMLQEVNDIIDAITTEKGNEIAQRLLTFKLITGRLRIEEVRRIQLSDWGKDMIKNAISQNENVRKEIEEIAGKGAIDNLSRLPVGAFLKILFLILGIVGMVRGGLGVASLFGK